MTDEDNLKERRQKELEIIRSRSGGVLNPEAVVEFAKNPKTALNSWFNWDDTEAAREYRLWQARQVIRVCVTVQEREDASPLRTYVSLCEDRGKDGYRLLTDVLSDEEMCEKLLQQALAEFKLWESKYRKLAELAPVFAAAKEIKKKPVRKSTDAKTSRRTSSDAERS